MDTTNNPAQVEGQAQDSPVETKVDNSLDAKLAEIEKRWKSEISGLNRRNSELEKALQEKELSALSEKERAAKEIELAKAEKDRILAETEAIKTDRLKEKAIMDKGLPLDFAQYISAKDESAIAEQAEKLSRYITEEAQRLYKAEANKNFGGAAPVGGETPAPATLQSAYDKAVQTKNFAQQSAILRQAAREGIKINLSI